MPPLQLLFQQIDELNPVDREQLVFALMNEMRPFDAVFLSWLIKHSADDYPSIVTTPNVCGGAARLVRTRIPVWTIERMRQLGVSEADILRSYPTLRAVDLVQVWSYVAQHRSEIDNAIRENEEE